MQRLMRRLAVGAALAAVALMGLAGTPTKARFFGYGFGFGYPVVYAPPPVYPVSVPPPVYPVYAPYYSVYRYGYRYRVHHIYRHVVHRRWCSCHCCR